MSDPMSDLNALFIRACEARWGKRWQTDAAEALGMSDCNIRYIVERKKTPKGGMFIDLFRILHEHQAELDNIIEELKRHGSQP
jgi:hypothetical protein